MANLFDYIAWRGDIPFDKDGPNEVDNFVLCEISYVDYNKIFDSYNPDVKISLKCASEGFCKAHTPKSVKKLGAVLPWENIRKLMDRLRDCPRFAGIEISDFTNEINTDTEMQFCAVTYHLNDREMFVSFRGTDDTIVGWKEDFRLVYLNEIPAQKRAAEYLAEVGAKYPNKNIYVGGHSKGGNLAKYSALCADDEILSRVITVYNNDGPGFLPQIVSSERFARIEKKVKNFVPQSSLVGQMFEHRGQRIIVKSNSKGVHQHDMFSWDVKGAHATTLKKFTRSGELNHEIFSTRVNSMTLDERREVIDMFCSIIDNTGAKTLMDISDTRFKSAALMLRSYGKLEKEKKQLIGAALSHLLDLKGDNRE